MGENERQDYLKTTRLLSRTGRPYRHRRAGRKPIYTSPAFPKLLKHIWFTCDQMCSKKAQGCQAQAGPVISMERIKDSTMHIGIAYSDYFKNLAETGGTRW